MIKVITYGTYDLLHYGHINLLKRAKALGDHLTVAVSTDEFNLGKGKVCTYPFEERALILQAVKYVDAVIPETCWEQKMQDVIDHEIDIFVMGDDWQGKFDFLCERCQVVYLPRTEGISTTSIKKSIKDN